jgi:hypothetical protein
MDVRDSALAELSTLMKVDTVKLGDGSMLVMTGNARVLVKGKEASRLSAGMTAHEPAFASVELYDSRNTRVGDITGEITSGRLGGLLQARDRMVDAEILEIDEMAASLIDQANRIHRAGYASDGTTTNIAFFSGTEARDIGVASQVTANPGMVAASAFRGNSADGSQAGTMGMLRNLVMNAYVRSSASIKGAFGPMVDPTLAMNAAGFAIPPAVGGSLMVNGKPVPWVPGETLNKLIDDINKSGAGVRAFFDYTQQRLAILGDGPITIYDTGPGANLTRSLRLQTRVNSLAPVNKGIEPGFLPVVPTNALSSSVLLYRTEAGSVTPVQPGSITVNGVTVNWDFTQSLDDNPTPPFPPASGSIIPNLNAALGAVQVALSFDPNDQRVYATTMTALPATAGAPIGPITIRDVKGNLAMVLNMEAQPTFGAFGDTMLAQMQAQLDNSSALKDQADAAVQQLQNQQDAIANVNLEEEKARLLEYLRAYEASIRAMAAMDEMLNVLINRMAVSTMGSSTSSVISS